MLRVLALPAIIGGLIWWASCSGTVATALHVLSLLWFLLAFCALVYWVIWRPILAFLRWIRRRFAKPISPQV